MQTQDAPRDGINILLFGAASAVIFSLIAQIGEQVDFLRFLPERTAANRLRWWGAVLVAGPRVPREALWKPFSATGRKTSSRPILPTRAFRANSTALRR